MKRILLIVLSSLLGLLLSAIVYNYVAFYSPLQAQLAKQKLPPDLRLLAYRGWLVNPNTLVIDLWRLPREGTMEDLTKALLAFLQQNKSTYFSQVAIAHRGRVKLMLPASFSRQVGQEKNAYKGFVRRLPQELLDATGKRAFVETSDDGLFISNFADAQEAYEAFHRRWYIEDLDQIPTGMKMQTE